MTNEQLQAWVEELSLRWFARPFLHRATFNKRLKTTGGRYFPRTHNIDISLRQWEIYGADEVEKIIKHELCHYHLHLLQKGYRHRDADFRQLLRQVGGSRHCRPLPDMKRRQEPIRYRLECTNDSCRMVYYRKRKVDVRKYACGRCRGKLRLVVQ
ncbi:MAG TPA: SprT family protein [Bacilli bacterium]